MRCTRFIKYLSVGASPAGAVCSLGGLAGLQLPGVSGEARGGGQRAG